MHLLIKGKSFAIAQMGPNFLKLLQTIDHLPTDAEISLCVDGRTERWTVHLPDGISLGQPHVSLSK
jgi:hypothetical protein